MSFFICKSAYWHICTFIEVAKVRKTAMLITVYWMILPEKSNFVNMNRFKNYIEWNAFGVCTAIGPGLGSQPAKSASFLSTLQYLRWVRLLSFTWCLLFGETSEIYMGCEEKSMVLFVSSIEPGRVFFKKNFLGQIL
jgi:hypothetical protein